MEIATPTINKYVRMNALAAARAQREARREYALWLKAYRERDLARIAELAKRRDQKARKASMAYHRADKFLMGMAELWEARYWSR